MRGVPAWRRRRRLQGRQRLTPLEHPSSVSALRADPPSPTRGEGGAAPPAFKRPSPSASPT
ncbi:MAG: hypothetical protein E5W38_22040 [Mesorhizobium sp.]|nr:MAG: hypothetical protein E5W38_22040 [Mesorhizobium sp.]